MFLLCAEVLTGSVTLSEDRSLTELSKGEVIRGRPQTNGTGTFKKREGMLERWGSD